VADKGRKQASRREETHSGVTRELLRSPQLVTKQRPRGETWRARAQERKGCFQALPAGISTYGEDGVVAGKGENH
jgi:hypothetical protein